jgi:hypothetical protein
VVDGDVEELVGELVEEPALRVDPIPPGERLVAGPLHRQVGLRLDRVLERLTIAERTEDRSG